VPKTREESGPFMLQNGSSGETLPRCRIMVLGVGGAGNKVIDRLIGDGLTGAECVAINTDLHDLNSVRVVRKVLIGESVTRGLSAEGRPDIGRAAVEESESYLEELLENLDVVFVVAGLGGGTGTGAAPTVAEIARRKGAAVVGVVTKPLKTERGRIGRAARALTEMRKACDTVVVIDTNRVLGGAKYLPAAEVFKVVDQVSANMIKGIVETLSSPSLVNLDFVDFKTVIRRGGMAVVGIGESKAPNRAEEAVRNALSTPLVDIDCSGVKGALVNVCGDSNMTIDEVNKVGEIVSNAIGRKAPVRSGARVNPEVEGVLKVTLVMTGVRSRYLRHGLGSMMSNLYDIESSYSEPEKSLPVDLGLDQIENSEG